jgi:hypothetical protein
MDRFKWVVFKLLADSYPNKEMTLDWLQNGVFLRDPSESNFDLKVDSVHKMNHTPAINNPTSKICTILSRAMLLL